MTKVEVIEFAGPGTGVNLLPQFPECPYAIVGNDGDWFALDENGQTIGIPTVSCCKGDSKYCCTKHLLKTCPLGNKYD